MSKRASINLVVFSLSLTASFCPPRRRRRRLQCARANAYRRLLYLIGCFSFFLSIRLLLILPLLILDGSIVFVNIISIIVVVVVAKDESTKSGAFKLCTYYIERAQIITTTTTREISSSVVSQSVKRATTAIKTLWQLIIISLFSLAAVVVLS